MAALVAPGICRYSVHGSYGGRAVVNIIDMKLDTTGSVHSRSEAIAAQAKRIIDSWCNEIVGFLLVDNYVAEELRWIDLDSLSGEVGATSEGNDEEFPRAGAGAQSAMPGNVAIRCNKQTSGGRGTRKGRMYLCGLAENQTDDANPNSMSAAFITGGNERLANLLTQVTAESALPGLLDWTSQWHVIHTIDGVFDSTSEVTGLTIDPVLGSQRRRLR